MKILMKKLRRYIIMTFIDKVFHPYPSVNTDRKILLVYTKGMTKGITVGLKKPNRAVT